MNPYATYETLQGLVARLASFGVFYEPLLMAAGLALVLAAIIPQLEQVRGKVLAGTLLLLLAGEGVLGYFHWRLYEVAQVVDPSLQRVTGGVAVPLWVESEKLFVWALLVAMLGVLMRRHRQELMPGVLLLTALLTLGAALFGRPFTNPLPSFIAQYTSYLQAFATGGAPAQGAYQGMESARQYYYNSWYMWVHPPLLFLSYAAFTVSFVATLQMIRTRYSAFETTAYRWAAAGYLPLTLGMLLGFPWAIIAWSGESWWWSGKVNMSLMMWVLYTAYLHARLYLRRKGMWKLVAAIAVISFVVLILTYVTTYIVPGAHSYTAFLEAVSRWA